MYFSAFSRFRLSISKGNRKNVMHARGIRVGKFCFQLPVTRVKNEAPHFECHAGKKTKFNCFFLAPQLKKRHFKLLTCARKKAKISQLFVTLSGSKNARISCFFKILSNWLTSRCAPRNSKRFLDRLKMLIKIKSTILSTFSV